MKQTSIDCEKMVTVEDGGVRGLRDVGRSGWSAGRVGMPKICRGGGEILSDYASPRTNRGCVKIL